MSTVTIHPTYAVRPARRTQASTGQVRLTRRGRLMLFAMMLAFVLAAALTFSDISTATNEAGTEAPTETIVVQPGQTLWDIAAEHSDGDVRKTVHELERLNALDSSMLQAGQELFVPVD